LVRAEGDKLGLVFGVRKGVGISTNKELMDSKTVTLSSPRLRPLLFLSSLLLVVLNDELVPFQSSSRSVLVPRLVLLLTLIMHISPSLVLLPFVCFWLVVLAIPILSKASYSLDQFPASPSNGLP
jgi:hypothetical protein